MWLYLSTKNPARVAGLLNVSESTVWRYISLFRQTGDVKVKARRYGPRPLMEDYEQMILLQFILENPGIYLHELQLLLLQRFGVSISVPTICRTLRLMGCTRQAMHRVALQRSETMRAKFMHEISVFDPSMLIWLDESGCDRRHAMRKYGYSVRGTPVCDQRLLIRGIRYTTLPIVSLDGILDVLVTEGTMDGDRFINFIRNVLSPHLLPFNGVNPRSVIIMDNASIHHVDGAIDLIENQIGARVCFLPAYSPDLNPAEGVFSQIKAIMKENDKLFQVFSAPRALLAMAFASVTTEDCKGHIHNCGYI